MGVLMKGMKKILYRSGIAALLFVVALSGSSWAAAGASTPLQVIQSGTDRALDILRSARSGEGTSLRERRGEILVIVDEYFNFHEMAKRALGRPWREQPPEKQQEFVRLFKQLLFNTYVDRVDTYTAGNERVVYDSERIDGNYAMVKTRVVGVKEGGDVMVEYRLHRNNGQWKVYDIIVEGISLVDNYRSQFRSILASDSFDGLFNRLQQKVSEQARS